MTARSERSGRRPGKKTLLIGAAAVAVALVAGVGITVALQPERVDLSKVKIQNHPQQVAANEPVVAAPAGAEVTAVKDVTAEFSSVVVGDLVDARSRVQHKQLPSPIAVVDQCLSDWSKANLAALAVKGAYEVVEVCGRPTLVLAGPAGADSKVLVYSSLEKSAPAGVKQLLAESTSNRIAFAGVRSTDDKAQLLAVAVLPDVAETAAADGTTKAVNTPPPGFAPYPGK
jgi:hypothetical protein